MTARFQELCNASGLQAVPPPEILDNGAAHLVETFLFEAERMAAAAATYINEHGDQRRLDITNWALLYALRRHIAPGAENDMDYKPFKRRRLCHLEPKTPAH
eukprot:TRINITY_DN10760_c0_g1_i1.p3 TRINITY_DN10760_c0_g1~~TRINITY_DN10760_c0_g1_i1.p3  ORF type:complete len:102 (+),score=26.92 TRINITY_DN10760_c0_g1_i1:1333-1638(+)